MSSGASSSSCPGSGMPWSEEQCCHLMPGWGTGVSNALKVKGAGMDPVSVVACSQAVAVTPKRGTKGMTLVKSCWIYVSTQWPSSGETWRATENFFAKAWHFCPSSAITLQLSAEMLFKGACCRAAAVAAWCVLALVSWASLWHVANSAPKSSSMWWQTMDALISSNSSRAVFISSCNWSSSLDRLVSLPSEEVRGVVATWSEQSFEAPISSLRANYRPPHCSSLCTCNWSRQPQAFVLGKPSVIMPMCPSLDKGTWAMESFIHA